MKPYRSAGAVVLLIILASCTSTPPEPAGREEGREPDVRVHSQDTAGFSSDDEEVSGDNPEGSSEHAVTDSLPSASPVSWPPVPAAAEIPLPEATLQNCPEPVPIFPSIIQVIEIDAEGWEEKRISEESTSLPVLADPQTFRDGDSPSLSAGGEQAVVSGPEETGRNGGSVFRDAGITGSTAGEGSGVDEADGAANKPAEKNLTLPGWTTVESREERVYPVSARDPHILILEGTGWTLKSSLGRHTNLERSLQPGATVFTFLLPQEGTGQFIFQRQDLSAKVLHFKTVYYRGETPLESSAADRHDEETSTVSVLSEQEKAAGQVTDLASLAEASPEEGPGGDIAGEEAATVQTLGEAGDVDNDSLFNAAVRYYTGNDYHSLARVLEQLQSRNLPFWEQDRLLLFLGRLHDLESPLRDERAALDYYNWLVEQYPGSLYWEEANRRARYIRRHFFQIR